jgi:hypothetical protein
MVGQDLKPKSDSARIPNVVYKVAFFVAIAPVVGYTLFLLLLTVPWIQKQ